jgi:hypothetical protein
MMVGSGEYRGVARALVAVLCAGGLVAIVLVLGSSDSGLTPSRLLLIALALAFYSLTGAAGVRLAGRSDVPVHLFGHLTVIASIVAFGEAVATFWNPEWLFEDHWRTAVQTGLVALVAANVSILLATQRPGDRGEVHAARLGSVLALVALCVLVLVEISRRGHDIGIKPMAVCAVVYVLGALLVPVLREAEIGE